MCTHVECYGNWVETEVLDKVFWKECHLSQNLPRTRGVKSCLLPVFVNNNHVYSFSYCLWLFSTIATELSSCDWDSMTPRVSNIYWLVYYKMSANPCTIRNGSKKAIVGTGDNMTYGTIQNTTAKY